MRDEQEKEAVSLEWGGYQKKKGLRLVVMSIHHPYSLP
jgi:hypothetical protein